MSTGKLKLGAITLAIGTGIGLLFAPQKGSRTRAKLFRRGADKTDELKEKYDEFVACANEKMESAKAAATAAVDKGKHAVEDAKKEVKKEAGKFVH